MHVIVQTHQILRLPRKMTLQNFAKISKTAETSFPMRGRSENDPSRIREWSENETVTPQPASQARLLFALATSILCWKIQHFALGLSFQISPNTAPATKSDTSTSPNTAPATQNDSHDQSSSHMKRYLQCAEQQVSLSKLTKYCACHEKWISWLILVTHATLFTMRGATSVIVQTHQILRLPRQMTLQNFAKNSRKQLKCHFQCGADPRMIRAGSEQDPRMKPSLRNPPRNRGYFSRPPRAFCIEKYNISRSGYHSKFHRILRLPRKVTLQLHQILRLPRKMTLMINPRHTWNAIYNARSNKCHCPNSPNTAPATKNESHDWSLSHMRRYLQCAEQQVSLSKLTKYCACHQKRISWLILVTHETLFTMCGVTSVIVQTHQILRLPRKMTLQNLAKNCRKQLKRHFQCGADPRMIRAGSEQDPRMKPSLRNPPRNRGYFSRPPRAFCIEKYNISRSGYHSKFHRILRLPRKVTLQLHRILRLRRKVTLERHQIVHLPRKVTLERHQIVHLPRKVTLELHQTVHLPRKVTLRYSTLL